MTDKTDSKEREAFVEWMIADVLRSATKPVSDGMRDALRQTASQVWDSGEEMVVRGWKARASLAASAGSEPVPFGHWFTDDPKAFATPGSGFLVGKEPPKNAINVIPLYTHPSPPEGMVGGWLSITGTLCSMGNIGEEDLAAISPETPRITLQAADGSVVHIVGLSREHVGGMAPQFYNQAQLILAPRPTTSAGSGKGE